MPSTPDVTGSPMALAASAWVTTEQELKWPPVADGADVVGAKVAAAGSGVLGAELGDDAGDGAVVGAPIGEGGDDELHAASSTEAGTKAAITATPSRCV